MAIILVSNDDGYESPGLSALAAALRDLGRVVVVAPEREQSGASHSLTLHHPLRIRERGEDRYSVDGTPTDCVNLGVLHLLRQRPPQMVVSGINHGYNLGDDVTYSGTVAAALEGLLLDVPSFAISLSSEATTDFQAAAAVAYRVAAEVLARGLPPDTWLNVNVPPGRPRGVRITRQGRRAFSEGVAERVDPKGRSYYWVGGEKTTFRPDPDSDFAAVDRGEVSITPLHLDWTNHGAAETLRSWKLVSKEGSLG